MIRLEGSNDTKMEKISKNQQEILGIILKKGSLPSSEVRTEIEKAGNEVSLVTIKRALSNMVKGGILAPEGSGRSVRYHITVRGKIFVDIDAKKYCAIEPDKRYGASRYAFDLFPEFPGKIFDDAEQIALDEATKEYGQRTKSASPTTQRKELERLVIELSWKSSRIEGNTYTLLDTEKLILENKEAPGHDKNEARMILNHKNAFYFIWEHREKFKELE